MFVGHFVQARLESVVFRLAGGNFLCSFVGHQVENVFVKDESVAGHFSTVCEGFEACDDACPLDEIGIGIVLIEFSPDHDGGLLEDFVGVGGGGQERADEAAQVRFVVGEALDEAFVLGVVGRGGIWVGIWHSLYKNTAAGWET